MAHLVGNDFGQDPRSLLFGYGHSFSDELERLDAGFFEDAEVEELERAIDEIGSEGWT